MYLKQWLASAVFTLFMFVSVPIYSLVPLLCFWGSWEVRFLGVRAWVDTTLFLLRKLVGLDYIVEGLENLPNEPCVIMIKHASAWETIAQMQIFGKQSWVLKRELMWVPVLGWVLKLQRPIAINRKAGRAAVQQVIDQGKARLASGFRVIVFPEGTRVPIGETRRYGLGGALLAQAADCPIVPVAHNAGYFWPRRGLLKKRGTIRLVVGKPIKVTDRDPKSVTAEVQDFIESTLIQIKPSELNSA